VIVASLIGLGSQFYNTFQTGIGPLLEGLFFALVLMPIGLFIDAWLYQLMGKRLLNAWKGGYGKSFTAAVLGAMPVLLFFWFIPIPVLGWIGIIVFRGWSVVATTIALAVQQKAQRTQTFLVILSIQLAFMAAFFLLWLTSSAIFGGGVL
jgi:hypothetical protein